MKDAFTETPAWTSLFELSQIPEQRLPHAVGFQNLNKDNHARIIEDGITSVSRLNAGMWHADPLTMHKRRVAIDDVLHSNISTVFWGMSCDTKIIVNSQGQLEIKHIDTNFETLMRGNVFRNKIYRYVTIEEAKEGHAKLVSKAIAHYMKYRTWRRIKAAHKLSGGFNKEGRALVASHRKISKNNLNSLKK